ncbi:MAG: VWA domain-containing protein [Candidatus Competibacteraceae bacterium]
MNALSEFHWLRPEWLWALLPLAVIVWRLLRQVRRASAWETQCDPHLLEKLLIQRARHQRWPLVLLAVAWVLAVIALAGPVWQKLPEPVYRTQAARVIVLDLSPSMNASDIRPSRIARARFKVLDLLNRYREGQTALVVFAGEPFVVSPLTDDTKTIAALVPTLSPELMPVSGDHARAALQRADELLSRAGVQDHGEIVLVTDGYDDPAGTLEAVTALRAHGRRVSVLAVGTEEGTPISLADGGFLKDSTGAIVVPRLDAATLSELARQGGGHFVRLSADDRDIDALSSDPIVQVREVRPESARHSMDRWREEGPWLVLVLLPLAAFAFRRGWLTVVALAVLTLPPDPASASGWQDWWARPDQQGVQALQAGDGKKAAELFQDPAWKGSAHYQAGNYEKALENFSQSDTADALYNRGNALTHLGRLQEAIAAYDQALKQDPTNADVRHNKDLVEKLLKQQQQQQQQQQSKNDSQNQQNQNSEKDQQSAKDSSADSSKSSSTDKENNQESQNDKQQSGQQADSKSGKSTGGNSSENQANAHQPQSEPKQSEQNPSQAQEKPADSTPSTTPSKPRKDDDSLLKQAAASSKPSDVGEKSREQANATAQAAADHSEDADRQVAAARASESPEQSEDRQAMDQWLRRIPDDPAGLLRRKFMLEHLRRQQQAAQRGE